MHFESGLAFGENYGWEKLPAHMCYDNSAIQYENKAQSIY